MPRYFFHLLDSISTIDLEGRELPNLAAARANAVHEARSLMSQAAIEGRLVLSYRIEITDADGALLDHVLFSDAVEVEL